MEMNQKTFMQYSMSVNSVNARQAAKKNRVAAVFEGFRQ
jgi:hypothetical protein